MTMRVGMLWLALLCLILGIGSPWVAPMFAQVAAHIAHVSTITVTQGALVVPATNQQAVLSTPVITIALILLLIVPFALKAFFRGVRLSRETNRTPWACGYDYEERMSISAGGFTHSMRQMFAPLYRLRVWLDPAPTLMENIDKIPSIGSRRLEGMSAYYAYALIVILVVLLMSIIGVK
jgi:hydrogenase-4 component B